MKSIRFSILFLCTFLFFSADVAAQKSKSKTKEKSSAYEMQGPFCCGLARVKKDHKWGYIDTTGNIVIPIKFNEVENFSDNLARVRKERKWGLYDNTGREIIKPTFDYIGPFINGKAKVAIDAEVYYMNTEGVRVAP
jgi:hypothetical protein